MYYHRVGTSQESDVLIHKNDQNYADFTLPENKALDKMI